MSEHETPEPEPSPPNIPEPAPEPVPDEERVRYEDDPANFPADEDYEPAELSAEEVPLEDSRKDDTTVLASDKFDSEGNRIE